MSVIAFEATMLFSFFALFSFSFLVLSHSRTHSKVTNYKHLFTKNMIRHAWYAAKLITPPFSAP
jgi:hypothetical protein